MYKGSTHRLWDIWTVQLYAFMPCFGFWRNERKNEGVIFDLTFFPNKKWVSLSVAGCTRTCSRLSGGTPTGVPLLPRFSSATSGQTMDRLKYIFYSAVWRNSNSDSPRFPEVLIDCTLNQSCYLDTEHGPFHLLRTDLDTKTRKFSHLWANVG